MLGGVLIAIGLYAVLWGKVKDSKISTDKNSTEVLSNSQVMLPENQNKVDDIEAASNKIMCKGPKLINSILEIRLFLSLKTIIQKCKYRGQTVFTTSLIVLVV